MGARSINKKHGLAGIKRRQKVGNPARRDRKHAVAARKQTVVAEIKKAVAATKEIA